MNPEIKSWRGTKISGGKQLSKWLDEHLQELVNITDLWILGYNIDLDVSLFPSNFFFRLKYFWKHPQKVKYGTTVWFQASACSFRGFVALFVASSSVVCLVLHVFSLELFLFSLALKELGPFPRRRKAWRVIGTIVALFPMNFLNLRCVSFKRVFEKLKTSRWLSPIIL